MYPVTFVLVTAFLFQVGFVNHVTEDYPYSYSLDLKRKEESSDISVRATTHNMIFLDQEVFSAHWLQTEMNLTSKVYADYYSRETILKAYALLQTGQMVPITNETSLKKYAYVYLRYLNVRMDLICERPGADLWYFNATDVSPILNNCDKVYSNEDSDIYFAP